jgi:hypothetical protein
MQFWAPIQIFYFFHIAPSSKPMAAATAKVAIGCSFICFST